MKDQLYQEVLRIVKAYHVFPSKKLGQNFLVRDQGLVSICELANLSSDDQVLEIGAGLGQITTSVAPMVKQVVAIEFDPRLYKILGKETADFTNITTIQADASLCDYKEIIRLFSDPEGKIKIIGNLPYYVAVPILINLDSVRDKFSLLAVTLQKELTERICAYPGQKAYGELSVHIQYLYDTQKGPVLFPEAFYPRPEVCSEILVLRPLNKPRVLVQDEKLFFRLVRAAFSHRRKTLLNALRSHPEFKLTDSQWREVLKEIGIDPQRRGETLSLADFARLSDRLLITPI